MLDVLSEDKSTIDGNLQQIVLLTPMQFIQKIEEPLLDLIAKREIPYFIGVHILTSKYKQLKLVG